MRQVAAGTVGRKKDKISSCFISSTFFVHKTYQNHVNFGRKGSSVLFIFLLLCKMAHFVIALLVRNTANQGPRYSFLHEGAMGTRGDERSEPRPLRGSVVMPWKILGPYFCRFA